MSAFRSTTTAAIAFVIAWAPTPATAQDAAQPAGDPLGPMPPAPVEVPSAPPTPRYRLEVGDWLIYERRIEHATADGRAAPGGFEQVQLWCVGRRGDELLMMAETLLVAGGEAQPAFGGVVHVGERGRTRVPAEMLTRLDGLEGALDLIVELRPALHPSQEFTSAPDALGRTWTCRYPAPEEAPPGELAIAFELADASGAAAALGRACSGRFRFDLAAGAITRLEAVEIERRGGARRTWRTRLVERRRVPETWCVRRCDEIEAYMRTLRHEDRHLDELVTRPAEAERVLRGLDRLWVEFATEMSFVPESPIRRWVAARQARLRSERPRLLERAALAGQWLGRPAPQWSLQDLEGNTIASEGLRDRVCLEYFWASGSRESLRGFEVLRDLRARTLPRRLNVVCLNMDADIEAARRAADLCGGGLTHVLSGPPVGGEAPAELPIVRVVDRDGTIRRVVIGYRASLLEALSPLVSP